MSLGPRDMSGPGRVNLNRSNWIEDPNFGHLNSYRYEGILDKG